MTRRLVVALSLALALAASAPAAARADATAEDRAEAQALFDDGRKLMAQKKFAEACPKLEESQRIDPGIGTLLNLAECQAHTGRTASAWANFLEAAYQAKNLGQAKRENAARAHAAALEPKLSRLTILAVVPPGVKLVIKRDGEVVSPSLVGTAVPVDPGEHTVSASAPGRQPWATKVRVEPGWAPGLHLGAAARGGRARAPAAGGEAPSPAAAAASSPAASPTPRSRRPPPLRSTSRPGKGPRAAGVVLTILGAGGLGTGIAFAALAKQKLDDSNAQGCNATSMGTVCPGTSFDTRTTAHTDGNIATGAFVAGGVLAGAGVGLLDRVGRHRQGQPQGLGAAAPTVTAAVGPHGEASIGLMGRF